MKKSIFSLFFVLLIVVSVFGGELLYKIEKEVKTSDSKPVMIGEFDTGKSKTLRVGASVEFGAEQSGFQVGSVIVETIDGTDSVEVERILLNDGKKSGSVVVNVPGKRLRFSAKHSGKYKVFVWSE